MLLGDLTSAAQAAGLTQSNGPQAPPAPVQPNPQPPQQQASPQVDINAILEMVIKGQYDNARNAIAMLQKTTKKDWNGVNAQGNKVIAQLTNVGKWCNNLLQSATAIRNEKIKGP